MARLTPHFELAEFVSAGDASAGRWPDPEAVEHLLAVAWRLERLRAAVAAPVRVTSGWRSPAHNLAVGGAQRSLHLDGRAADIVVAGYTSLALTGVIEGLIAQGLLADGGLGTYPSRGHVHLDTGPGPRRWRG
jgi:uncharacterized protein YcbK (DUF882 family)